MKSVIAAILTCELLMFVGIAGGSLCYGAQFSEDVWPCADFDNKMLQCESLHLGTVEGKEDEVCLIGEIEVLSDIEDGFKMNVEIWKILDIGKEFMYHVQGDICSTLEDESTAWYPLVESMNITKCPIAAGKYPVKGMTISLNHTRGMLTHELCGEYIAEMRQSKGTDTLSCYEIGIIINEYSC